jgi:hypothetical protein
MPRLLLAPDPSGLVDPAAPLLSPAISGAFVLLAAGLVVLAVRAVRRDSRWLRDRRPGPLDSLPLRPRAKRIHIGLRALSVLWVLLLAATTAANSYFGYVSSLTALLRHLDLFS